MRKRERGKGGELVKKREREREKRLMKIDFNHRLQR